MNKMFGMCSSTKRFAVCLIGIIVCFHSNAHTLFRNGQTDYGIVNKCPNSLTISYAVSELQSTLQDISGIIFNVKEGSKKIYVGTKDTFASIPEIGVLDGKSYESFVYFNKTSDIYIISNSERGCLYGVYSFLENELGCRWYSKDIKVIPQRKAWRFRRLFYYETPGILFRNILYKGVVDNGTTAAHIRSNWEISYNGVDESYRKGGAFVTWGAHSLSKLVPVERYFDSHPEYFSLREGKRQSKNTQLCLTNPAVLQICIEGLRDIIKSDSSFFQYIISQYDNLHYCKCDECTKVAEHYGGQSGLMLWFVNQIAEALEDEFPEALFGMTAYQYTRNAPKNIKPRENVSVRLSDIECCFSHPLSHCEHNESFMKDLVGWSKLTDKLFVTDYVVSFKDYLAPYPNFNIFQDNIRTLRDNNVIGIFEMGAYNTDGAEFADLRTYVLGKLLWNPDCDVDALIKDYMKNVYGKSAKYVLQYFKMLQGLPDNKTHLSCLKTNKDDLYTEDFIEKGISVFEKALKAADNEETLKRVESAALPVYYIQCRNNPRRAIQDGSFELFKKMAQGKKSILRLSESDKGDDILLFTDDLEKKKNGMN